MSEGYCCDTLKDHLTRECHQQHIGNLGKNVHPYRNECPDVVLTRLSSGIVGIIIHDGGGAVYAISYCPWCGSKL